MVLLAAAVCNKTGKALLSRQFVDMTRSRVEGLLASFPKLMTTGKQHTFVETESVRYVYQPIDKIYMVLLTTRNSNILEDLETLRLFARVIPEYCKVLDEADVIKNAFSLIFAFDEIVALGYRENVSLAQIRTFTEMDSQEERIQMALRQTQEREAKEASKRKAKELTQLRKDAAKTGRGMPAGMGGMGGGGHGISASSPVSTPIVESRVDEKPAYTSSRQVTSGKAMKLGTKGKDVDQFVDKLQSEGERVMSSTSTQVRSAAETPAQSAASAGKESVHIESKEDIKLSAGRDGGLENMEITGVLSFRVSDERMARLALKIDLGNERTQIQLHPKFDKEKWRAEGIAALKNPEEAFPLNNEISILKWRLQTTEESEIPLAINCWPSEAGKGCSVNIEYTLNNEDVELRDVVITIPIPPGTGSPVVGSCDGAYSYERSALHWQIPLVDASNNSGTMEFSTPGGKPSGFFPVKVDFTSSTSLLGVTIDEIVTATTDEPVKFSTDHKLNVSKYEIV
ncbi:coatomer subunit delta-like [Paramacrobiotus metropolitanus]|uniref:coatomer subunit delta-like n=1 Tax=Paramacrobiotus metropolitanus TaxID=2943436 RepID=UPI002445EB4C|nr:coatomer subunit delta-like [Paramacrobiotus metropolitanus]